MRVIIEITIMSNFGSKRILTARKLADLTDWHLVSVRDIPFKNLTVYTIEANVSPTQLNDLRKAGYEVESIA